jgi:sugar-specific transcriptional regulator TrmB
LGLSYNEREVYVKALTVAEPTITAVAEATGLERVSVYHILAKLEKLGLVLAKSKKFERLVQVESPAVVLQLLKRRQGSLNHQAVILEQSLPELVATYRHRGTQPKAQYFIGKEQFIALTEMSLQEAKGEMLYFGHIASLIDLVSLEYDTEYGRRRMKKKIYLRILVPPAPVVQSYQSTDQNFYRESRLLPENFLNLPSFHVFGNKIVLWNAAVPSALVIEDMDYVKFFTEIFEFAWQQAPKNVLENI